MEWSHLFYLLGGLVIAWLLWRGIKGNPEAFSKKNLGKSFYTMGILALLLIGFIGLLILLLRG